ncbi:hypothetical protein [Streptomyces cremeus]|uniref:Uncharacterized protein n=1 Tax=Streptomyces cremeus TaxID=66881 RepID=A0ABV5P8U9_STRCM
MSDYRDRRQSDVSADNHLTGHLVQDMIRYLDNDTADERFASVVLNGCLRDGMATYPPEGHGYPAKGR